MNIRTFINAVMIALIVATPAIAQDKPIKNRLDPEDYDYVLADGVTTKEITFYSEGVACWGKVFYPKGFSESDKRPGIVLGHGWTGTHASLEQYANRFADNGMVAMAIDYRGWGNSNGFISLAEPVKSDDQKRRTQATADVVVKRTRLLPMKQVEDYRNAISFIQGEPGVDPNRIGIWGSSFSGGHIVTVSALDSRVKAAVGQIPAVSGKNVPRTPRLWPESIQKQAIERARTGKSGEFQTGFSTPRMVDTETSEKTFEYHPYHYVEMVPETTAILFIGAENEELYGPRKNKDRGEAAAGALKGPSKYIELPGITHFEAYSGEAFEIGSKAATDWYLEHLK
jgi:dienelactone hydrolase